MGKQRKKRSTVSKRNRPSDGNIESSLRDARLAYQASNWARAAKFYRQYLKSVPDDAEAWHELGGALYQSEQHPSAIKALENACHFDPLNSEYASDLGGIYLMTGKFDDSRRALEASLALSEDAVGTHYNLSIVYREQGQIEESIESLIRCISIEPEFADAHYNLGVALRGKGRSQQALSQFEKVAALAPDNTKVLLDIARSLRDLRAIEDARRHYENYLRSNNDVDVVIEFAEILYNNGEPERAENILLDQSKLTPSDDRICFSLGVIRQNMGNMEGAQTALHEAFRLNPNNTDAILGLSRLRQIDDLTDPLFETLNRSLERSDPSADESIALNFSIAKIYDDVGAYDEAFRHYTLANNSKRTKVSYDRERVRDHDAIMAYFDSAAVSALREMSNPSDLPILVVGMPRSGTTLAEQIISSHSTVVGGGELQFFPSLVAKLPAILDTQAPYPECVRELTAAQANDVTSNYVDLLRRHSADAKFVTDKLPGNYMNVGLFLGLFPNAKVVSCRRDPLDVVLSIYFQYFADGHDYAWDVGHIVDRFIKYHRLMEHWQALFPESIFDVHYESLVKDFDEFAPQLIDFCGLPWGEACAKFYEHKRDVKTASNWQVRQPLYDSSLARWRNYEKHLARAIEQLADYKG